MEMRGKSRKVTAENFNQYKLIIENFGLTKAADISDISMTTLKKIKKAETFQDYIRISSNEYSSKKIVTPEERKIFSRNIWSPNDTAFILWAIEENRATMDELAEILDRSKAAIKTEIYLFEQAMLGATSQFDKRNDRWKTAHRLMTLIRAEDGSMNDEIEHWMARITHHREKKNQENSPIQINAEASIPIIPPIISPEIEREIQERAEEHEDLPILTLSVNLSSIRKAMKVIQEELKLGKILS